MNLKTLKSGFQSTHSLRSATGSGLPPGEDGKVSIHALLAECDQRHGSGHRPGAGFNPRTPCGVRQADLNSTLRCMSFQSTHSLRSATYGESYCELTPKVSIHALLAECDPVATRPTGHTECFNPRTPCGVRQFPQTGRGIRFQFQSTHSLRSATKLGTEYIEGKKVSIHALLAECDRFRKQHEGQDASFNPRTPCGVRPIPWV